MDGAAFDLSLMLTLLRVDVFGDAQARIVAQLRKRQDLDQVITMSLAEIDESAYRDCAEEYQKILIR